MGFLSSVSSAAVAHCRGVSDTAPPACTGPAALPGQHSLEGFSRWKTGQLIQNITVEKFGIRTFSWVASMLLLNFNPTWVMIGERFHTTHELGVYILCNPLTLGFVIKAGTLNITALLVITNTQIPQRGELHSPPFYLSMELLTQLTNCFSLSRNLLLLTLSWILSE